jgi:hypothetical protein
MAKKRTAGKIKSPAVPVNKRHLKFSLEYLQLNHPRFPISNCSKEFFVALFGEVARYQEFTVDAFTYSSPAERRHPIHFPGTHEPNGFQNVNPSQDNGLWTDSAWQFGVPAENGGIGGWRVHGFISDEVFYIVWFDPLHQLDN